MESKKFNPAAGGTANGVWNDHLGELIGSEINLTPAKRQVAYVARRFALAPATAVVIATLAFNPRRPA